MQKKIKHHDIEVPVIGYGTWRLWGDECVDAVSRALSHGYRHIDTAQMYENEAEVGQAIAESAVARSDVFLTTKVLMDNARDGDLQRSVDESLSKLKTDYVDLLLLHWPVHTVPLEETMRAMQDVQKAGKARSIGGSNFNVTLMKQVVEDLGIPIATNQSEYHPYLSQKKLLAYTKEKSIFLTAYRPLAKGDIGNSSILKSLADHHGKTVGQICLRWLVQQDGVVVIPKAAQDKHMLENLDIFDFELSEAEMDALHLMSEARRRYCDTEWSPEWDDQ